MMATPNKFLIVGAALSAIAAILHIGIVFVGAPWYRFFGAGEDMVRMAEAGSWYPALITTGIAIVLFIWALYALSGAGGIRVLPLLRTALCTITAVYLLRGLAVVSAVWIPDNRTPFLIWSSLVCLGFGIVHLVGLTQVWSKR